MRLMHIAAWLALVVLLLSGCSSIPHVDPATVFELPGAPGTGESIAFTDRRHGIASDPEQNDDWIRVPDRMLSPMPARAVSQVLAAELHALAEPKTVREWLGEAPVELHFFDAKLVKLPVSGRAGNVQNHAGMAAVHPLGPLIGMGMTALMEQAARPTEVRVEIRIKANGKQHTGYGTGKPPAGNTPGTFLEPARRAIKNLAQHISLAAGTDAALLEPVLPEPPPREAVKLPPP
jgi:hypothetical protein